MFFNSNNSDRIYSAEEFSSFFSCLVSNGVLWSCDNNLIVSSDGASMAISIAPGVCWISGYCYQNLSDLQLILATASGVHPRIDRIIIRWSLSARAINAAVLTGAPASSPAASALTRTSDIYELCLAEVLVPAGVAVIVSSNITDKRTDAEVCGLANSLVSAVYQ
jgi:hypothetical protein